MFHNHPHGHAVVDPHINMCVIIHMYTYIYIYNYIYIWMHQSTCVKSIGFSLHWCPWDLVKWIHQPWSTWIDNYKTQFDNWLVVGPPLWKIWKSIGMIRNPIYGKITLMATKPPTSNYKASRFKFRMAHKPKKLISTINVLVPSGWDTPSMMAIWNRKPSMMAHLAEGYDSNKMRNTHLWS